MIIPLNIMLAIQSHPFNCKENTNYFQLSFDLTQKPKHMTFHLPLHHPNPKPTLFAHQPSVLNKYICDLISVKRIEQQNCNRRETVGQHLRSVCPVPEHTKQYAEYCIYEFRDCLKLNLI